MVERGKGAAQQRRACHGRLWYRFSNRQLLVSAIYGGRALHLRRSCQYSVLDLGESVSTIVFCPRCGEFPLGYVALI